MRALFRLFLGHFWTIFVILVLGTSNSEYMLKMWKLKNFTGSGKVKCIEAAHKRTVVQGARVAILKVWGLDGFNGIVLGVLEGATRVTMGDRNMT